MFKPNDEQLNKEYRNRTEQRAANARLAQNTQTEKENMLVNHIRNTGIGSTIIFVVSILSLLIFFGLNSAAAEAQEDSPLIIGGGGDSGGIEMMYLRSAVSAVQDDDLERALYLFDATLDSTPDFAPAYTGRAYVNFLNGDYEAALEDALIAVELNPADGAVYYVLGEIHFVLENYGDARFHYEAYQLWIEVFETEPLLINLMVEEDSQDIVNEHLGVCIASISQEAAS